jgi:hypothetical protein
MYIKYMTATLYDILKYKLIKDGDSIEFNFKGHYFRAKIQRGGLISQCTVYKPRCTDPNKILQHVTSFSSLTSWTEACLQDILEEYFTRYSSWKRVYHVESGQTMGELRDRCKLLNGRVKNEDVTELYKEIHRLQTTIKEMSTILKSNKLYQKKWSLSPFIPVSEEYPYKKVRKRKIKDLKAFDDVQTLMMS